MKTTIKTAKGRKISSTLWLQRQLNDPYVQKAKKDGYRSRAAYKLTELDDKFHFLAKGKSVVDLGSAPGGWTQVAVQRCGEGKVVAMDYRDVTAVAGAIFIMKDFTEDDAPALIKAELKGPVDVVLSDMAPNASGTSDVDHMRIVGLVEIALEFAIEVLKPGGSFVAKVWQGGTEKELLARVRKHFTTVKHAKPAASRKGSAETFLVAMGFRR